MTKPAPYFRPVDRQLALWRAALAWLGTPFAEHQRARGAGADCVQLAAAVYIETGLLDRFEPGRYTLDAGDHQDQSQVLAWLEASGRFARSDEALAPGDLLAFRNGRCAHHVGIALAVEPADCLFLHSLRHSGAQLFHLADTTWRERLAAVYTPTQP